MIQNLDKQFLQFSATFRRVTNVKIGSDLTQL